MSAPIKQDLDAQIRAALTPKNHDILTATQELGWFELGLRQFTGKHGWVTWTIMIVQITLFLAAIWCGAHFFAATEAVAALKWGLSAAVLILSALQLKLSLMPQMQADRIIREIKRLQLMAARQDS